MVFNGINGNFGNSNHKEIIAQKHVILFQRNKFTAVDPGPGTHNLDQLRGESRIIVLNIEFLC